MQNGNIFIISGPSGSGKDTILQDVFKAKKDIFFSISSITRSMRPGDIPGKYNFISKEEFEKGLENNEYLEYNIFLDNYYGTPKTPILKNIAMGNDVIIEVDVNGAASIKAKLPEAICIFIMPPSLEILHKRLSERGSETDEQIKKRMDVAVSEIGRANEYDYIVVNDALEDAVDDFLSIMRSEKLKTSNQKNLVNEVLK